MPTNELHKFIDIFCLYCYSQYKPIIQAGTIIILCPICKRTEGQQILQTYKGE